MSKEIAPTKARRALNKDGPQFDFLVNKFAEDFGLIATCNYYDLSRHEVEAARIRIQNRREHIRAVFSEDVFLKFRRNCLRYAASRNTNLDPSEFASWAIVQMLEGRGYSMGSWSVVRFLYSNYIKSLFGESDTEKYEGARGEFFAKEIDNKVLQIADTSVHENMERENLFDIATRLGFELRDRICFLLYFRDGFTEAELGKYLGTSKQTPHNVLKKIREKIMGDWFGDEPCKHEEQRK